MEKSIRLQGIKEEENKSQGIHKRRLAIASVHGPRDLVLSALGISMVNFDNYGCKFFNYYLDTKIYFKTRYETPRGRY